MRFHLNYCLSAAMALSVLGVSAPGAHAQSFLQNLFGNLFTSAPASPHPAPAPVIVEPAPASISLGSLYLAKPYPAYENQKISRSGHYRTYCVRQCDGYYFPIDSSASPSTFDEADQKCQNRCRGAQLFYLPKNSTEIEEMVDLRGRRYDEMPTAFVYRKTLIDGCSCRPMPWAASERARHNSYAYREEALRIAAQREDRLKLEALARSQEWQSRDDGTVAEPSPEVRDMPPTGTVDEEHSMETALSEPPALAQEPDASSVSAQQYSKTKRQRIERQKARPRRKAKTYGSYANRKYAWPGDR